MPLIDVPASRPVLAPVRGCPSCRSLEYYEFSRELDGSVLRLRICRACDADSPLVRQLDTLSEQLLAEDLADPGLTVCEPRRAV